MLAQIATQCPNVQSLGAGDILNFISGCFIVLHVHRNSYQKKYSQRSPISAFASKITIQVSSTFILFAQQYCLYSQLHYSYHFSEFFCVIYFLLNYAASINILRRSLLMLQQKQVLPLFSSCVRRKMTTSAFISGDKSSVVFNVCVDTTSSHIPSGQSLHILSTKLQAVFIHNSL